MIPLMCAAALAEPEQSSAWTDESQRATAQKAFSDALQKPQPELVLPATRLDVLDAICALENVSLAHCDQEQLDTMHALWAGMYVRTLRMPWDERIAREGGIWMTGAVIKLATVLIVNGSAQMLAGDGHWIELDGYNVIQGSAGRKQVFVTRGPVEMTMIFPTQAKTVEAAEDEVFAQADRLMSRTITRMGE